MEQFVREVGAAKNKLGRNLDHYARPADPI
jgi:hypothetical protein